MSRTGHAVTCPSCQAGFNDGRLLDYWCPRCGSFLKRAFCHEHPDPGEAWRMTDAEIAAEFAAAGLPFRPMTTQERAAVRRAVAGLERAGHAREETG